MAWSILLPVKRYSHIEHKKNSKERTGVNRNDVSTAGPHLDNDTGGIDGLLQTHEGKQRTVAQIDERRHFLQYLSVVERVEPLAHTVQMVLHAAGDEQWMLCLIRAQMQHLTQQISQISVVLKTRVASVKGIDQPLDSVMSRLLIGSSVHTGLDLSGLNVAAVAQLAKSHTNK